MSVEQVLLVFLSIGAALTSLIARSWAMRFASQQQVSDQVS
jgi:hypothetical protein